MIDWLKCTAFINDTDTSFLLDRLNFKSEINARTGEYTDWPKRSEYANIKFVLIPTGSKSGYWFEVSGSLHKLWEGGTNYQPFNYESVCYTIDFLSYLCQIAPSAFTIRQLEFGVNLSPPPVPTQHLLNMLITYQKTPFSLMKSRKGKSIGYESSVSDYRVKIYDKARQLTLPHAVCRVEVHTQQHVSRLHSIDTLADLTKRDVLTRLGYELTAVASQITFDDSIPNFEKLRPSQRCFITTGRNPRDHMRFTVDQRNRFKKLIRQHGTEQYAEVLAKAVATEWQRLLNG